jgi:hypothetical protein
MSLCIQAPQTGPVHRLVGGPWHQGTTACGGKRTITMPGHGQRAVTMRRWVGGSGLPRLGGKMAKGRKLRPAGGIYSRRRETSEWWWARTSSSVSSQLAGPAAPLTHTGACESPIPGWLTGGPRLAFELVARVGTVFGPTVHGPGSIFYFFKLNQVCKL